MQTFNLVTVNDQVWVEVCLSEVRNCLSTKARQIHNAENGT
jgi:hypothetical protein